jgi:predicted Fe-Mo cluster-binding NifX family protein
VSEHFGKSPCFLICDLKDGKVRKWKIASNPGTEVDVRMGLVTAEFLIDQGVDAVLVRIMGDGPYWMLKSNSIEMFKIHPTPSSKEELESCLENYRRLPVINK